MIAKVTDWRVWLRRAALDLGYAELGLIEDKYAPLVSYHAQQCAEKAFKAFLLYHATPFKFVHELSYLARLCTEVDSSYETVIDIAAEMQNFESDLRYPFDDGIEISGNEAKTMVDYARSILSMISQKLPHS